MSRQAIQAGSLTTYGYDFLDRLTSVTPGFGAAASSLTYRYVGDRITEAWSVGAVPKRKYAFGYDDQTNLSAVSVYDAAGTTITSTTCLVHDALNRLTAVGPAKVTAGPDATACRVETDLSAVQVRFRYDAQNRRIARQDGVGAWKQYAMGPDGSPLSELTRPTTSGGTWTPLRDCIWLEGKVVAQVEYPGPQVYAVHVDHLGLPRSMTGSGGTTAWSAATRPYGDMVETSATGVVTNLRLPGQYDEKLLAAGIGIQGPYYNWNRWYLPTMGRYMELDPIAVAGGFNESYGPSWYGYAAGNPLRYADSTGLCLVACTRFGPTLEPQMWACVRIRHESDKCSLGKNKTSFEGVFYANSPATFTMVMSCSQWDSMPHGPPVPWPYTPPGPLNPGDPTRGT
jgi:RHS repeat-associated protein